MNFYRDFCRERLKDMEGALTGVADSLEVEDDDEIDAQQALCYLGLMTANASLAVAMLGTMAAAKVYKIGQTYQQIDAAEREDYQLDAEGVADAADVVGDGVYGNFNPTPIGVGNAFTHPAYPRVLSRVPVKNIHRLGPPGLFNGCLFKNGNETLFSSRMKGIPPTTFLYKPKQDIIFADPKALMLPPSFEGDSIEDVRIFSHRGATLLSGGVARLTGSGWLCRIALGMLNEAREFSWVHAIESPIQAMVEKNWVFFSQDGRLYFVYYPSPHVVYEVKLSDGKVSLGDRWEAENWAAADLMDNARGGAPPVRVGDEFYHFYHSQHRHGRGTAYQVGLYTFETKPPWNLRRVLKGPLISLVPSKREMDCIFPVGAFLEGEKWHLSCGIQDHETMAISLDFCEVERYLTKV